MQAMILCAGRGERLRPITDTLPKPLIKIGEHALVEHHLLNLAKQGVRNIIINVSYLSDYINNYLQDGSRYGVSIQYSSEPGGMLGTGGGIVNARPLFRDPQLLVINGDIYTEYQFSDLQLGTGKAAHLVMVENPAHNPQGDFTLGDNIVGLHDGSAIPSYTYSGIGLFRTAIFEGIDTSCFPLTDILSPLIANGQVTGELHHQTWIDVGTPERLEQARQLEAQIRHNPAG